MTNFNWQTEEDHWDEAPAVPERNERNKTHRWPQALVALIILIAVGLLLYRQVRRQLDAAVTRTENDVRRTHELILQAAGHSDRDLLNTLISARDESWLYQQLDITEDGLLYNPHPFGLFVQHDAPLHHEFELSPDLNEAEVFTTRSFTVQSPTGVSETVALEQYAIYRRSEDRWLFAPPQDLAAFWGESQTAEGQYLTITYPTRDAEAVQPLFQYLDEKVAEMCATLPDFTCPNNLHIHLNLETAPISQAGLLDADLLYQNSPDLTLPTLTLVGTPVDEAAQNALYRGYATHVVRTAMINALDWECCRHALFFRALLDYQLAQLGLSPNPLHPADYEKLFSRFRQLEQLNEFWAVRRITLSDTDGWQWVYALTEFILTTPLSDQTAATMQQDLSEFGSYLNWINNVLPGAVADITVQQAWLNFIYGRSLSGQVAAEQFIPPQDVLLACEDITAPTTFLYRYNWAANEWIALDQFDEAIIFMLSTPDDSAVILQGQNPELAAPLFLWQDGRITTLLDSSDPQSGDSFFIGLMSPDGRKLTMLNFEQGGYSLLDLDQCDATGCQIHTIPGLPEWSPSGSQMILQLPPETGSASPVASLSRIDSAGQVVHMWGQGAAFAPFWLGEEAYGYIEYGEQPAIYMASVADDEPQLLLSEEELLQAIPEEERPDSLTIQEVAPNPANHNILAVTASHWEQGQGGSYLFIWNRQSGELFPATVAGQVLAALDWLSNGEWVVVPAYQTGSLSDSLIYPLTFYLHHVSGEGQPIALSFNPDVGFPLLDRSLDDRWLLLLNSNYIELIAPNQTITGSRPYRRLLTHNFNNCRSALFIR